MNLHTVRVEGEQRAMAKGSYLDQTERFVEWLEGKRRRAGLTQEELARLGGASYSYYTKFVSVKRLRQTHGDGSRNVLAPKNPKTLLGVLRVLSERLGEDCVAEGLNIWGHTYPPNGHQGLKATEKEAERKLVEVFMRLQRLPPDDLQRVDDLIQRLQQ
jgi:transcriptional regulator with XRE-family HTH domain